ncbi:MAG: YCF48-related protein [Coriobacteriia bacterium]|nr:YCF48-related protein [Coriobacteriia bacterium]
MRLSKTASASRAAIIGSALVVALLVARSAFAVAAPPVGQGYIGLPPDWVLQQYWSAKDSVVSVSFPNATNGWVLLDGSNPAQALSMTTNGGKSWQDVQPVGWHKSISAISFSDAQTGWAVGENNTIYKTTDSGSTWTTVTTSVGSAGFNAVQAVDSQHVVAVGSPLEVLSTSNGSDWSSAAVLNGSTDISGQGQLLALHMTDATHGWACGSDEHGYGRVIGLSNGSWTDESSGTASFDHLFLESISFADALHGWVVSQHDLSGAARVYSTTNGGASWSLLASNVTTQYADALAFVDTKHGFIGCANNGPYETLLETTDGGATWNGFNPNPPGWAGGSAITGFALPDSDHVWAGGDFGFGFANSDPAAIWALVTTPSGTTTYTLNYIAGPNGSIVGSATQVVASGADGTAVTAKADAGCRFTGWSDGVLTATRTDTNAKADHTFTASFAIDTSLTKPTVRPSSPKHGITATFETHISPVAAAASGITKVYLSHFETKIVKKRIKGQMKKVKVHYWRLRKALMMTGSSSGRLRATYKLPDAGSWKMYAAFAGSANYAGSASTTRTFTAK